MTCQLNSSIKYSTWIRTASLWIAQILSMYSGSGVFLSMSQTTFALLQRSFHKTSSATWRGFGRQKTTRKGMALRAISCWTQHAVKIEAMYGFTIGEHIYKILLNYVHIVTVPPELCQWLCFRTPFFLFTIRFVISNKINKLQPKLFFFVKRLKANNSNSIPILCHSIFAKWILI